MKTRTTNAVRALGTLMLCAGLLLSGCYDDSALRDQLNDYGEQLSDHESRLKELERLCSQANTNIEALQTIVSALQDKDYVTGVAPIKEGDKVLGYSITFSKSDAVTIYHGKDGHNGNDGYVPVLGVKQDGEQWYWTVDCEWLTDAEGNKVRVSAKDGENGAAGVTPILKIEEGYWHVSYDGGKTWESETLGQATGDKGDSMFGEVTYDADYVYITLTDGQELVLPRSSASQSEGSVGPAIIALTQITATTATFTGHLDVPVSNLPISQITVYYSDAETFHVSAAQTVSVTSFDEDKNFTVTLPNLKFNTKYNYCIYVKVKSDENYSEVREFTTPNVLVDLTVVDSIIVSQDPGNVFATFTGRVSGLDEEDMSLISIGVAYSTNPAKVQTSNSPMLYAEIGSDGSFMRSTSLLELDTRYYYCYFIKQGNEVVYGDDVKEFQTYHPYSIPHDLNVSSATDLSSSAFANCYIVSNAGLYKFKTVKGNSSESVGNVANVAILWETFGTSTPIECFDLIKSFCYKDGYIAFQTADTFKEGNAGIAAKDASGNILWSWHIWLTDQPEGQEYYNNAGTMMDRNLGATSATPGDVCALGLLYQWGRKDPFLGSSSITSSTLANYAGGWPRYTYSDSSDGTIAYATANPTTFITYDSSNYDWYYTGCSSTDNTRWTTSESAKSIYDPCPAGWRVPDGGENGVWSKACGLSSYFSDHPYDSTNEGINFSGKFGSASTIWYPASGSRYYDHNNLNDVGIHDVGDYGDYWSASPNNNYAYGLYFSSNGRVNPSGGNYRAHGQSVRCLQE